MNNSSCIFWFSGTGNSLYAAKTLSDALKMPLARITGEAPPRAVGGRGKKVGFVFPSYYGNLPRAVRAFAQKLQIRPDTYIFAIVTMGGAGQGSLGALKKVLKAKGLRLNFGRGVHMPPNYVLAYNPADAQKS
ncbi:MAG: EFR1 family ferrodoxin, partial [Clostridiales bacterium]|nr:EFR1 family ferrodoxin [Clostridiales bacterium]